MSVLRDLSKVKLTARDYDSMMKEVDRLIEELTPNWKPLSLHDPGYLILSIAASMADQLGYYLDASARESFLSTVQQRKNAAEIARGLGYRMSWFRSATASVSFSATHTQKIIIPKYFPIATEASGAIEYFTSQEVEIPANSNTPVSVEAIQGTVIPIDVSYNDIQDNRIYLPYPTMNEDFINFYVDGEPWTILDSLIDSYSVGKFFTFSIDEHDLSYIELVSYWRNYIDENKTLLIMGSSSRGINGRVGPNTLTRKLDITRDSDNADVGHLVQITNLASKGGYDPETVDEARVRAIREVSTHDTLVVLRDFETAAERYPEVVRATAVDIDIPEAGIAQPYKVDVYVIKEGYTNFTIPDLTDIANFLKSKKVAIKDITVKNGTTHTVNIGLEVYINAPLTVASETSVRANVLAIIEDFFRPYNRTFGEEIRVQELLNRIESEVPMVSHSLPTGSIGWTIPVPRLKLAKQGTVTLEILSA